MRVGQEELKAGLWPTILLLYTLGAPLAGGTLLTGLVTYYHDWLIAHPHASLTLGALLGTALTGVALMPSVLLAVLFGFYTGGSALGFAVAALAVGLAATLGIWWGRLLSASHVQALLHRKPQWQRWFDRIQSEHGRTFLVTVFVARLSPHMPFAATNLLLAQLRYRTAALGVVSWLGLLPRTLIAAGAGSGLANITSWRALTSELPSSSLISAAFAVCLLYLIVRILLKRRREGQATTAAGDIR